jgi:hypothetical protein
MPNLRVGPIGPTGPTGAAPPEPTLAKQRIHPADEWPKAFQKLYLLELILVLFLAFCLVAVTLFLSFWAITGYGCEIHARVVQIIRGMNTGWKVCLLILVPLFFRPIFKFMFYLREGPFSTRAELPSQPVQPSADYQSGVPQSPNH